MRIVAILLLALLSLAWAPQKLPSVAFVKVSTGHGSGVFVSDRIVLTANHVIENEDSIRVIDASGGLHDVRSFIISKDNDLAILILDKPVPNIEPARIDCRKPELLERLTGRGYPEDLSMQTRILQVSGFGRIPDPAFDFEPFIWVAGAVIPGDSGGPVSSASGVVGLMEGVVSNTDLGFVTPLYLEPLLCGGSARPS